MDRVETTDILCDSVLAPFRMVVLTLYGMLMSYPIVCHFVLISD